MTFNNPLPVELTSFSAACDQGVVISWSTASERNSDVFVVEKSRDLESWTNVASLDAAGNSNVNLTYSIADENSWNGLAYYRLKQIDFNGSEKIYGPISSSCENGQNSMVVYPNPSKGAFTVEVLSTRSNVLSQLQIIDVTGKLIASESFKLDAGVNQFYFNSLDLPAGVYVVRLEGVSATIQPMRLIVE